MKFEYIKAYAVDCLFTCFLFCFIGFYNGMGYTTFVMAQGIIGAFLVRSTGIFSNEQADAGFSVPYRPCHTLFHNRTDSSLFWMFDIYVT